MDADEPLTMSPPWKVFWGLVGVPLGFVFALGIVWLLNPASYRYRDLTQDWLSGRCYFDGQSIYTWHRESGVKYFGPEAAQWAVKINAHPPVSVLLLLPLAKLPHEQALLVWNVASLGMLGLAVWVVLGRYGLNCEAWHQVAAYCLLVTSIGLLQQVKQSQLNPLLALLIALTWVADRRGQQGAAGLWAGLAAGIKLFPGFLLLYFVAARRWKALAWAAATIAALNLAAVAVFGPADTVKYFREVVPAVHEWRSAWINSSLAGFWSKLFDVTDGRTREFLHAPWLAKTLTYLTSAAVSGAVAWQTWRARSLPERDLAFAATVVGMLLVSPVTWDHYMLLLVTPIAVLWYYDEGSWARRAALWCGVGLVGYTPAYQLSKMFFGPANVPVPLRVAEPWHAIVILPLLTYGLIVLLVLALSGPRKEEEW